MCEESGEVTLTGCSLFENSAEQGGAGLCCEVDGHAILENTIVAFSTLNESVLCTSSSSATLVCCDVFGNAGGDWVGYIADQLGQQGNISADPLFCLPEEGDFTIANTSPCAPENNPVCGLIGAWDVGCAAVALEDVSWAQIKASYRE